MSDCPKWGKSGHLFRPYDGAGKPKRCACGLVGEQGELRFDPTESKKRRDSAVRRVDENADDEWKEIADRAIDGLAGIRYEFIVDDVWKILDVWKVPRPREGRAVGPRMTAGKTRGVIEPTDRFRPSDGLKSHGTPRRIWRSKIYEGEV